MPSFLLWVCGYASLIWDVSLSLAKKPLLATPSSSDVIQRGEIVSGVATLLLTVCEHAHTQSFISLLTTACVKNMIACFVCQCNNCRCTYSSQILSFTSLRLRNFVCSVNVSLRLKERGEHSFLFDFTAIRRWDKEKEKSLFIVTITLINWKTGHI